MKQLIKDGTDKIVADVDGGDSSTPGDLKIDGRLILSQQADTASAATVPIANNLTRITGTTDIEKISATNWQQGSIVVLKFQDTLTLVHGAGGSGQLYMRGASDLIVNAEDVVMFVLVNAGVGANTWYQINSI